MTLRSIERCRIVHVANCATPNTSKARYRRIRRCKTLPTTETRPRTLQYPAAERFRVSLSTDNRNHGHTDICQYGLGESIVSATGTSTWLSQLLTSAIITLSALTSPMNVQPHSMPRSPASLSIVNFASVSRSASESRERTYTLAEFMSYRFHKVMSMQMFGKVCAVFLAAVPIVVTAGFAYRIATGRDLRSTLFKIYSVVGALPGASAVTADNTLGLFICSVAFFAGKFTLAVVIGIVSSDIASVVKAIDTGNYQIIEEGHMVILNTNHKLRAILQQIAEASKERGTFRCPIVVLADQDKKELDAFVARAADGLNLTISTRTGCTHDIIDLKRVAAGRAKCIIWLEPNADEISIAARRAAAIASVKALGSGEDRYVRMIVQTSQDSTKSKQQLTNVTLAYRSPPLADENKLRVVEVYEEENLDRFLAQCALQPNLSKIMMDVFQHNEGKEFYITEKTNFRGKSYSTVRRHFHNAVVCGIYSPSTKERGLGEQVRLNPPEDTVLQDDDRLIVLSNDRWHCQSEADELPASSEWTRTVEKRKGTYGSENIVVLCFGPSGLGDSGLLEALCQFADKHTKVTVVAKSIEEKDEHNKKCKISYIRGNPASYETLKRLRKRKIDSIVLVGLEDLSPKVADAQLLSSLIQIQEVADAHWEDITGFNVVSPVQLSDTKLVANHIIAEGRKAYRVPIELDMVPQNDLASGVLVQVAGFPQLDLVFKDLLSEAGTELYIRNAEEYGLVDRGVIKCFEVSDVVRRFGETFLGVLTQDREFAIGPEAMSGREYKHGDKIVVLAQGRLPRKTTEPHSGEEGEISKKEKASHPKA